jgi:hypothetical protein
MTVTEYLRTTADYLAQRKGLPVLVGVGLVVLNLIFSLLPPWPGVVWLAETDLLLQLGVIIGLIGMLLGDAL